jgi:hypothetical protein
VPTPFREPEYIVEFDKANWSSRYRIRWKQSILTGKMLHVDMGYSTLLASVWKIRLYHSEEEFRTLGEVGEEKMYHVSWYDTWVPCWMVMDATLIHDFWTHRYQDRQR